MFKNISTLMIFVLMVVLISSNITQSQTKKVEYPVISIAPVVGVQFPIGGLNDLYKASWNAGLDINLKVNREVAFYLNATYFDMLAKKDLGYANPDGSYIAITAGPRYIFASPKLKANFFLEAGLGAYIHTTKEYTITGFTSDVIVPSETKTSAGVNVGPGVLIPVGGSTMLIMKAKLHYIFESDASRTFISAVAGVEFRL